MISDKDLKEAMNLSMLDFTKSEYNNLKEELNKEYEDIEKLLSKLDLEDIKQTYFVSKNVQRLREDKVYDSMDKKDVLRNAPEEQYGYFKLMNVRDE